MADAVDVLTKLARSFADVTEHIACAGTAIEQASFKTGGKSFLFAQRKGDLAIVRLKLESSQGQATTVDGVELGKGGWTTCRVALSKAPSAQLKRWVRESYDLSVKKPKFAASKSAPSKPAKANTSSMPAPKTPRDLNAALKADPGAAEAWKALAPSHRRAHIEAIEEAKKPETRARRIAKAVAMLNATPAPKAKRRAKV